MLSGAKSGDSSGRARLMREARAAAALNHPHICTVHEVGEVAGEVYMAMELVAGTPLTQKLQNGPLDVQQVIRYGIQLADALAHAHQRGVVHRDLKCANVSVTPEGRLKILDFGIARRLSAAVVADTSQTQEDTLTQPGAVVGTVAYMAPEQLRGQPADKRTDIWALGVILYEMIAGKRPFQGETTLDLSSAILKEPAAEFPGGVPLELKALINRCLEKEAGRRYQHASELRSALEVLETGTGSRTFRTQQTQSHRRLFATAALLVLIGTAVLWLKMGSLRPHPQQPSHSGPLQAIAVLPLENLSGDASQDFFADGIHEALITDLGKLGVFKKVIVRASVKDYARSPKSVPQIASELGVDALVTGSVMRSGDRVRVTAHLVNAQTQTAVWDDKFERPYRDLLAIQNEIVTAITKGIGARLTPEQQARLVRARPISPEAHDAYLLGMFHLSKYTPEGFEAAFSSLQQAIEKDPENALPYAGLALAYSEIGHMPAAPADALTKAKEAALKALKLDPTLAEAHSALAQVKAYSDRDYDWAGVEEAYRRALNFNPNLPQAHAHYGWYLMLKGERQQALSHMKAAQGLSPREPIYAVWTAEHLLNLWYVSRDAALLEQALQELNKALKLDSNFAEALHDLGWLYAVQGLYDKAIAAQERARHTEWGWGLGVTYALQGEKEKARQMAAEWGKSGTAWNAWGIAEIYAVLGDNDAAFKWLEQSYNQRHPYTPWMKAYGSFASLRGDPRFSALLRRMNVSL